MMMIACVYDIHVIYFFVFSEGKSKSNCCFRLIFKSRDTAKEKGLKTNMTKIFSEVFYLCGIPTTDEPRCEKTGLRGFRPGPTQSRLYSYRRWLEA